MSEASKHFQEPTLPGFAAPTSSPGSGDGTSPLNSPAGPRTEKSGPALAPASPSALPVKARASTTPAISGPTSSGSSASAALQRSLENRLRRRLNTVGSMEYSQTWKESVTPAGRSFLAHTASARRISDNEYTGWPTVTTSDDVWNMEKRGFGTALSLGTAARLTGWEKTPQASDGDGGVMGIRPGTTGKYKLRDYAMLAGWATATATKITQSGKLTNADGSDWNGTSKPHQNGKPVTTALGDQVKLTGWPTTTTRDSKSEGEDGENRTGSPSLPALAHGVITELFRVPTGRRVVLAPEFSLWLMGFPEAWANQAPGAKDWQESQAALGLECSRAQETPSSPSLPPSL